MSNIACARVPELRHHPALDLTFKGASEPLGRLDRESEIAPLGEAIGHGYLATARTDADLAAAVRPGRHLDLDSDGSASSATA